MRILAYWAPKENKSNDIKARNIETKKLNNRLKNTG